MNKDSLLTSSEKEHVQALEDIYSMILAEYIDTIKEQSADEVCQTFDNAINFALEQTDSEGRIFLRMWREGEFQKIRENFPDFDLSLDLLSLAKTICISPINVEEQYIQLAKEYLCPAIKQYKHNTGEEEYIVGLDYNLTLTIVATLIKANAINQTML